MSESAQSFDVKLLWRHKLTIVGCCIIGIAAGVGYLIVVPPTYQAQARVKIEPQGIAPEDEITERIHPEFLPTQAETIRSPVTIAKALETVDVARPANADPATFDPVRHVLKSLQATPVLKANVLTISYQSTDAEEAVELIEALIESYRSDVAETDKGTANTNVQVIAEREKELRQDLEQMQIAYAEHRKQSPLIADGRDGTQIALAQLTQLDTHLSETRRRRLDLQSRLKSLSVAIAARTQDKVAAATSSSTGQAHFVAAEDKNAIVEEALLEQVVNFSTPETSRTILQTVERLRFARLQRDRYDSIYGDKHPDLIAARAEVVELENLLTERLASVEASWKSELQAIDDAEAGLLEDYEIEKSHMKTLDTFMVKDQMLLANLKKVEDLHSATLADLMAMQSANRALNEGRFSISVRVLDAPELLDDMAWPKPKPLLAASALLGLLVGCAIVFLRSQMS